MDILTMRAYNRGTGNTLKFSCYNSASEKETLQLAYRFPAGKASDTAQGETWATSKLLADNCYAVSNKTGSLIGTAFVARDMMRIVDALGEDGLLRYWGEKNYEHIL